MAVRLHTHARLEVIVGNGVIVIGIAPFAAAIVAQAGLLLMAPVIPIAALLPRLATRQ